MSVIEEQQHGSIILLTIRRPRARDLERNLGRIMRNTAGDLQSGKKKLLRKS